MSGAVDAIYALNTHDIEIEDCTIYDSTTGIRFEKYTMNPKILSNTIYDTSTAVILDTQVFNPYIYSNVIYDCSTAINLIDATNYTICSNTIDNVITGIQV
jgi:parallel beta-helix repeat protein